MQQYKLLKKPNLCDLVKEHATIKIKQLYKKNHLPIKSKYAVK